MTKMKRYGYAETLRQRNLAVGTVLSDYYCQLVCDCDNLRNIKESKEGNLQGILQRVEGPVL